MISPMPVEAKRWMPAPSLTPPNCRYAKQLVIITAPMVWYGFIDGASSEMYSSSTTAFRAMVAQEDTQSVQPMRTPGYGP